MPGALQQADCQAWLGVGVPSDMVVTVRTRADGASATVCKSLRVTGKGRKGAKATQVVTRCRPAATEDAAAAPASRAALAASRGQAAGAAKAGGRAGAARTKAAGKTGTQGSKKVAAKGAKMDARPAARPARSAR